MGGAGGEGLASACGGGDVQNGGDNASKREDYWEEGSRPWSKIEQIKILLLMEISEQDKGKREGSSQV